MTDWKAAWMFFAYAVLLVTGIVAVGLYAAGKGRIATPILMAALGVAIGATAGAL